MYTIQEFDKEKTKVMNYIMYKKRTEHEVINKFENTMQKDILYDIIEYVKEAGYLDDNEYISRAINEFIAIKTLSIKEIKYKLYSKGINSNLIEDYIYENKEMLEEYEKSCVEKIILKKSSTMEIQEIRQYLIKKGYSQESIKEILM